MQNDKYLEAAKKSIEKMTSQQYVILSDFDKLSQHISDVTHIYISPTTLRRFWGYQEKANLRPASLNIIARYMGYSDWSYFCNSVDNGSSIQSSSINRKRLLAETLSEGALVELLWNPDRRVVVRYEGDLWFSVVSSERSKLHEGSKFRCMVMLENEPLYLTNLTVPGEAPLDYVCGQKNGIRFREMKE